jgi:hypothetical protein
MTTEWYNDVGDTLVKTMVIAAIFPLLEFAGFWTLRAVMRVLDRGFQN